MAIKKGSAFVPFGDFPLNREINHDPTAPRVSSAYSIFVRALTYEDQRDTCTCRPHQGSLVSREFSANAERHGIFIVRRQAQNNSAVSALLVKCSFPDVYFTATPKSTQGQHPTLAPQDSSASTDLSIPLVNPVIDAGIFVRFQSNLASFTAELTCTMEGWHQS
ncbi:hypothetical protein MUK42_27085 [Musa troglodytarum]|uniref:Uncharacterized protein n=1 Tax=Musa troglodytarum TaxID=320322 RepID=A0A9E7KH65_9LILI|nr:hypothetical protein MUK42_27085 [Musa troglodytarum]